MKNQLIHRVGVFPDTIDPLMCRDGLKGVELDYLVARGSVEEAWAKKFLPREKRVTFELDPHGKPLSVLSMDEVIADSNLSRVLRRRGIRAIITSGVRTPATHRWAQDIGVRVVGPSYLSQRQLGNKLWCDSFVARYRLPHPVGQPFSVRRDRDLPFRGVNVLQAPYSTGGLGTFFVSSGDELRELVRRGVISRSRSYLARPYVEGTSLGIAVFVCQDVVCLSALRKQCFFAPDKTGQRDFAGLQWVPTGELPRAAQRRIDEVFLRLGRILHGMRYFGFANLDFILDGEGNPQIIECNPRLSTASTQLFYFPELTSGLPVGKLFIENFFKSRRYAARPRTAGLPQSTYRGSVLQIMPKTNGRAQYLRIARRFHGGIYSDGERALRFKGPDILRLGRGRDEFIFLSYAKPGERYAPKSSLGQILANYPLFTPGGRLSRDGERLMERFNPA